MAVISYSGNLYCSCLLQFSFEIIRWGIRILKSWKIFGIRNPGLWNPNTAHISFRNPKSPQWLEFVFETTWHGSPNHTAEWLCLLIWSFKKLLELSIYLLVSFWRTLNAERQIQNAEWLRNCVEKWPTLVSSLSSRDPRLDSLFMVSGTLY